MPQIEMIPLIFGSTFKGNSYLLAWLQKITWFDSQRTFIEDGGKAAIFSR